MPSLPNAHIALVDERKITLYLLSDSHPAGRSKATFFRQFGFRASAWQVLRDALISHLQTGHITSVSETEFGKKYIIDGALMTPAGQKPHIRAIWFVATGSAAPRLVTAYPAERR